uniref:Uncharacterized protein n=1 Tax=Chromera velia CCMP2878 TaxID=1169474 RepID=A0A0G4I9S8_9ALVE|eukprot:Cvel_12333.t1-p1 / transcript=Cvel_12333.t1 / gene=Cvel_12333 / organism=Chromera_velia_CCMP2878 / gene_product=hypothetical protein / transcript_product=hypothetical protein / location=Cvel_scaffold803:2171-9771(-) / protein_length=576 / sequence_SO=supercontig / SO=protein_coding / is_pseudo=false
MVVCIIKMLKGHHNKQMFTSVGLMPVMHTYFDAAFKFVTYAARLGYVVRILHSIELRRDLQSLLENWITWATKRAGRKVRSSTAGEVLAFEFLLKKLFGIVALVKAMWGLKKRTEGARTPLGCPIETDRGATEIACGFKMVFFFLFGALLALTGPRLAGAIEHLRIGSSCTSPKCDASITVTFTPSTRIEEASVVLTAPPGFSFGTAGEPCEKFAPSKLPGRSNTCVVGSPNGPLSSRVEIWVDPLQPLLPFREYSFSLLVQNPLVSPAFARDAWNIELFSTVHPKWVVGPVHKEEGRKTQPFRVSFPLVLVPSNSVEKRSNQMTIAFVTAEKLNNPPNYLEFSVPSGFDVGTPGESCTGALHNNGGIDEDTRKEIEQKLRSAVAPTALASLTASLGDRPLFPLSPLPPDSTCEVLNSTTVRVGLGPDASSSLGAGAHFFSLDMTNGGAKGGKSLFGSAAPQSFALQTKSTCNVAAPSAPLDTFEADGGRGGRRKRGVHGGGRKGRRHAIIEGVELSAPVSAGSLPLVAVEAFKGEAVVVASSSGASVMSNGGVSGWGVPFALVLCLASALRQYFV